MRTVVLLLRAGLALLLIFCLIAYLAGSLAAMATDADRMLQKMISYSDTSLSGVGADEYPALAISITDHLSGKADTAQIDINKNGQMASAFSQKELLHLEDIRGLIGLANTLRYAAVGLVAVCVAAFFIIRKKSPALISQVKPQKALSVTLYAFFGASVGLLVWGLIDFNSLFYIFHEVLFTNDLWLLDSRTDLLLQLMPPAFFTSYGQDLIKNSAVILLSLPLAAFAFNRAGKEAA